MTEHGRRLLVVGAGGAGCNALEALHARGVHGYESLAVNTDAQALHHAHALGIDTLHLGTRLTRGLGAGGKPAVGMEAAGQTRRELEAVLHDRDLVFITAGLGGGTGTGSAPVIAQIARESGALTLAVVTTPFAFEGRKRAGVASDGLRVLSREVDVIVAVDNNKLLLGDGADMEIAAAFSRADQVLAEAVSGLAELVARPGIVNVDMADLRRILKAGGRAVIGTATASSAESAVRKALQSPLLSSASIDGSRAWLLHLSAGTSLRLRDVEAAARVFDKAAHAESEVAIGVVLDAALTNVRATVIATRFAEHREEGQSRNALIFV